MQEENQSATTKSKNKSAMNNAENRPSTNKVANKRATSKTQNKPSTSKIENKPSTSKIENKPSTSKAANKPAPGKTTPAKKLQQPQQNGKQTVTKKALVEPDGRNTAKTNILPVVKKNLPLLLRKDIEKRKEREEKSNNNEILNAEKVESIADAWSFNKSKFPFPKKASPKPIRSQVHPEAEAYDMNHKRRGVAIIFNHMNFVSMPSRNGSEKDAIDLANVLHELHFEVRVYNDPSSKNIAKSLEETAAEDHTDADCLVVVAMSHGDSGLLHSYDSQYSVQSLWTHFIGGQCPTLAGKPKLFFIQACRGKRGDNAVKVIHETDSATSYSIPEHADIMVAYSTYDGFYSFRNADTGSWFIQAICEELSENWRTHDLLRMMTSVVRRVAIGHISYVPHDEEKNQKKQVPSILTMLTRLVYFSDKSVNSEKRERIG